MQTQKGPSVTTPLPSLAPAAVTTAPGAAKGPGGVSNNARLAPIAPTTPGAGPFGPGNISTFRAERTEQNIGGRTVFSEPGRLIIKDPNGQAYVRHSEVDRFRLGASDVRVQPDGVNQRTTVVRPDGSQIITINDRNGNLMRRVRRGPDGREIIIIDNERRGPRGIGGFFVVLPPPVIQIPMDRYIVDAYDAPPDLIYQTLIAPPVDYIERPYTLDEIRYSPTVRERMPSIDVDTINFDTGSWDIAPDQAENLRVIADGMNRAIQQNPRTVFLIEGHTDAVGNDIDNLSLSDRRAESAATLLTQQFGVPPENLTSQGYGEQYLKIPTDGPDRRNRRVTIRNITPLLNGGQASLPPPPPGVGPGGR
jgi:outer membrane protein OmpA-like peptidoglycan-associated protein